MSKGTLKRVDVEQLSKIVAAPLHDYFEVVYLKRTDQAGMWAPHAVPFPTEAEANAHADALREGNQGAIKVMPRNWA